MANIQNELNNIKNAVFGKDVRDSIHDAIKTCYDDASIVNDNANMEVKIARGVYDTLGDRLNEVDSQLEHIGYVIKSFVCDGVTDNTEDLINELNYINTNKNITKVFLPKGEIVINSTIEFKNDFEDRKLEFIGDNTTIKLKNNSYCFNQHKPMAICYSNITLNNINFDGNILNNYIILDNQRYYSYQNGDNMFGSIGVALIGENINVKNCNFNDISWSGVDVAEGNNIQIFNNRFNNVRQDCVPVHNAENVKVYNNVVFNNANHAFHAYSNCSDIEIFNNNVYLDKSKCIDWQHNFVNNHNYVALKIDHELYPDSKVSNVKIYNNIVEGQYLNALEITGYTHEFYVYNNTFISCNNGIKYATPTIGAGKINNNVIESKEDCIIFKFFNEIEKPTYFFEKNGELELIGNNFTSNNSSCIGFNIDDEIDYDVFNIVIKNNNYKFSTYSINYLHLPSYIMIKDYKNYPNNLHNLNVSDIYNSKSLFISKDDSMPLNLLYNTDFAIKNETKPLMFNNRTSVDFSTNVEIIDGKRYSVLTLNKTNPTSYNALAYNTTDISEFKNSIYTLNFNMMSESTHSINVKIKIVSEDGNVVCEKILGTFETNNSNTNYSFNFKIDDYESIGKLNSTKFELYFQIDNASSYTTITNLKIYNLSLCEGVYRNYDIKNKYVSRSELEYLMSNS